MRTPFICLIIFLVFASCSKEQKRNQEAEVKLLEVPPSVLGFSINFSRNELEQGINKIIPSQIWDGAIVLKNGKDSLFLNVKRSGKLDVSIVKNEVFVSVPLDVEVAIKKKVLGVTLSNLDAPITFDGDMKASAQIKLEENWDMNFSCLYRGFDLKSTPTFNVLGLSFKMEQLLEDALEDHSDQISDIICIALNQAFDFRTLINNIYAKIQQGIRVAKNPRRMWLYAQPYALSGVLIPKAKDTISLHLEFRTGIIITPEEIPVNVRPLKNRGTPLNTESMLLAYPEVRIPLKLMARLMGDELLGKEIEYQDYKIKFTNVAIRRYKDQLEIDLTSSGDITGHFLIRGKPNLDSEGVFTFEDFSYEVAADEEWVQMAEWAIHEVLKAYVSDKLTFNAFPFLDNLDTKITDGISKAPVSSKMKVSLDFRKLSSQSVQVTDDYLQWIFFAEGEGALNLKSGIFENK